MIDKWGGGHFANFMTAELGCQTGSFAIIDCGGAAFHASMFQLTLTTFVKKDLYYMK